MPRLVLETLRAHSSLKTYADRLMQLHDELAEIKVEHSGSKVPSPEPLVL